MYLVYMSHTKLNLNLFTDIHYELNSHDIFIYIGTVHLTVKIYFGWYIF